VRSGFRDVAPLLRDRFLTADIPMSMHIHAGRCRAEGFTLCRAGQIDSNPTYSGRQLGCVRKKLRGYSNESRSAMLCFRQDKVFLKDQRFTDM